MDIFRLLTNWRRGAAVLLLVFFAAFYCSAANTDAKSLNLNVTADKQWIDTGMDVKPGDKLHITAKGTVAFVDKTGVGPGGAPRGWKDTLRDLTVASAGRGALVGQIGNDPAATPFFVGADSTVVAPAAGRLFLGVNQTSTASPTGKFQVHIDRTAAAEQTASGAAASSANYDFKPLFDELQKDLPLRVSDKADGGNPGDLVNFVLVGDQQQVTTALQAAGWVVADKTNSDAVVGAVLATLGKQVYTTLPMSTLYLFGRPQDFGFENAQAVQVARQRNHFRIWQAPFRGPKWEVLWAGAGTHDIGLERDDRSPDAITHKIDPDVDKERDFIGASLQQAGWVQAMGYLDRPTQIKEAKTATGGAIKSDGRTLVIVLKPVQAAK